MQKKMFDQLPAGTQITIGRAWRTLSDTIAAALAADHYVACVARPGLYDDEDHAPRTATDRRRVTRRSRERQYLCGHCPALGACLRYAELCEAAAQESGLPGPLVSGHLPTPATRKDAA